MMRMKRILIMESGSFKVIGGAAKDTYNIYRYLESFPEYSVDVYGDFSKFGKDVSYVTEAEIFSRKYDVMLLNSIRDMLLAGRYIEKHDSIASVYTDRADVVGHYARSPIKRIAAYGGALFSDPSRSERIFTGKGTAGVTGRRRKIRNFFSKSYELHMLRKMRHWLTCYVAINADQVGHAKGFFGKDTHIEYVPRAPHDIFKKFVARKEYNGALYVGRLEETQKNLSFMINGVKRVIELHKELEGRELLRIAGEGPDEQRYKAMVNTLNLGRNVTFLGFIEDGPKLVKLYNNAGFFVSTSTWEGMGRSIMEAMACGLPVLLNEQSNAVISYSPKKTLVEDERTGILYNRSNLEDFADKFYALYSDEEQTGHMGDNASIFIGNELTMGKVLSAYKAIIDKAWTAP